MTEQTALALNEEDRPLSLMLSNPSVMRKFELACGQQAGSVMINIYNAAASNPEIWNCVPETVINAALDAAALKLSIAASLGQGCILPYKKWGKDSRGNWIVKETRASFIPMKRGIRELAMRTHEYRVLNSFTVKEGQSWEENQMTGLGHIVGLENSKNAPAIGYGAYLLLFSGYEATEYMSIDGMLEHCERYSPSWDKKDNDPKHVRKFQKGSKWDTDFDMMAEGVVLKRLIRNKGVISDRDKDLLSKVDNLDSGIGPDLETLEIYDAEPTTQASGADLLIEMSEAEMQYQDACEVVASNGERYGDRTIEQLVHVANNAKSPADKARAAKIIIDWRNAHPAN